jgi:ubiquinone/menaquinone biosynthesis C-methylase UbiE
MNQLLADTARIKTRDKVLDAGCGIGGSSIWLAKKIGAEVTGINICQEQLNIAKKFARRKGVENLVKFYNRDFTNTEFKDEFFDVVWAIESMCHAESKKYFLSEAHRVLKKGGRLIIADGFQKKENFTKDEQKIMNEWFLGMAVPNITKIKEFEGYLRSLKFKNIELSDITRNVMPSSRRIYYLSIFCLLPWRILRLLGLRKETHTNNLVAGANQYKILKDGLAVYGLFCAEK